MVTLRSKRVLGNEDIYVESNNDGTGPNRSFDRQKLLNGSTVFCCREISELRESFYSYQSRESSFPMVAERSHSCCCFKCCCGGSPVGQNSSHRVVIVDTETTGVTQSDQIIEIAAIEVIGNHITENCYHAYIKPTCRVHPMASRVHGLKTDSQVLQQAREIGDVFPEFVRFVAKSPIVCHNTSFDMRFLRREGDRVGAPFDPPRTICTLRLFRSNFKHTMRSRGIASNLSSACSFFEIEGRRKPRCKQERVYHNALEDATLTAKVYVMLHRLGIVHLCPMSS